MRNAVRNVNAFNIIVTAESVVFYRKDSFTRVLRGYNYFFIGRVAYARYGVTVFIFFIFKPRCELQLVTADGALVFFVELMPFCGDNFGFFFSADRTNSLH